MSHTRNPSELGYKQSLIVVMETGKIVYWTGVADDPKHAEGLAISYAKEKHDCQIWDTAFRPVLSS